MLHFVCGNPGAGKSYWATKIIFDWLVRTQHTVVTNVAIFEGELNALIQARYPEKDVNIFDRVCVIDDDDVVEFYTYRHRDAERLPFERDDKGRLTKVDYLPANEHAPVCYVLDEVHLSFPAREWHNIGKEVMVYLSQHRKLGDEIFAVTQNADQVDKQFRMLAQSFTQITNLRMRRVWGFQAPEKFTLSRYPTPLKQAKAAGIACEKHDVFDLDEDLAKCYDTAKGKGIIGLDADKKREDKGVSMLWLLPVVGALVAGVFLLPKLVLGGGIKSVFGGDKFSGKSVPAANKVAAAPEQFGGFVPGSGETPSEIVDLGSAVQPSEPGQETQPEKPPAPKVVGVVRMGTRARVYLSDGTVLTERDRELMWMSGRGDGKVIIDRQLHQMEPPKYTGTTNTVARGSGGSPWIVRRSSIARPRRPNAEPVEPFEPSGVDAYTRPVPEHIREERRRFAEDWLEGRP